MSEPYLRALSARYLYEYAVGGIVDTDTLQVVITCIGGSIHRDSLYARVIYAAHLEQKILGVECECHPLCNLGDIEVHRSHIIADDVCAVCGDGHPVGRADAVLPVMVGTELEITAEIVNRNGVCARLTGRGHVGIIGP